MQSPRFVLPSSLFLIVTGQGNNGKSYQLSRLLRARSLGGEHACLPAVVLRAESSSEGTMGDLLADDERVLSWPAPNCDDAIAALKALFPAGQGPVTFGAARRFRWQQAADKARAAKSPPPPEPAKGPLDHLPVRAVFAESLSKMYKGQADRVRDDFNNQRSGSGKGRQSVSGKDQENNNMRVHNLATGRATVLVDHLNACSEHQVLIAAAVHTRGAEESTIIGEGAMAENVKRVVGEAPDFGAPKAVARGLYANGYAPLWNHLATSANVIAHAYATTHDFSAAGLEDINASDPDYDPKFGLVCTRGTYPGLGYVGWSKRQECNGWLGNFALAPRLWHPDVPWQGREAFVDHARGLPSFLRPDGSEYDGDPDLGLLLESCLAQAVRS